MPSGESNKRGGNKGSPALLRTRIKASFDASVASLLKVRTRAARLELEVFVPRGHAQGAQGCA